MPTGKYKKRRPMRSNRNKKMVARRSYTTKIRSTNVFPRRMITRFKYTDTVQMAIDYANGNTVYYFNLNGLYDPDGSGTGHQPYGFDEAMALYSRYRVYKCTWHIAFPNNLGDTYTVAVVPTNGSTSFATQSFGRAAETPMAVTKVISAGAPTTYIKGSVYLPKLNGVKPSEYKADDRYIGTAAANPAEVFHLNIVGNQPFSNAITVYPTVTLVYYAELLDPNIVAQS